MKRWYLLAIVPLVALWVAVPVSGNAIPHVNLRLAASPALALSPSTGKPGTGVTAQVSGFTRSSAVVVAFNGVAVNGSGSPVVLASAQFRAYLAEPGRRSLASAGNATVGFRVPDLPPGRYAVTAKGFAGSAPPSGGQPTDTPAVPTNTAVPATQTSPPAATSTSTQVTTAGATSTSTSTGPTTASPVATDTFTPVVQATPTNTSPPTNNQSCPGAAPGSSVCVGGTSVSRPVQPQPPPPTRVILLPPSPTPTPTPCSSGQPGAGAVPQTICFAQPCSSSACSATSAQPASQATGPSFRMMAAGARQARQAAAGLTFSGDQASAIFTITAPSVPFSLSQSASCAGTIVVGQQTTCTITEMVTNNGVHTLDFSHTVVNHISPNVRVVSASSSTGTIAASGNNVTWSSFSLAPNQSASAAIQVSFTPNQSQVSSSIPLSNGITADAVDVTTHQRFTLSYGPLATKTRVQAHGPSPSGAANGAQQPSGNAGGGTTAQAQSNVGGLPSTGGAAVRPRAPWLSRQPLTQLATKSRLSRHNHA